MLAMNASLFDRARADRFAQLVDEASGGRRHHARSRLDDELAELVSTSQQLQAMPISVQASPVFKRDLRAQLLATAVREGIGSTAQPEPKPRRAFGRPRPRARGAIVVGIAAGTLALSGVSMASGEAIPGDALYGMKRSTERAQLALAGSELTRGQLYLDFARTRLTEAYAVRSDPNGFVAALKDMDGETQQGIRALIASAMAQHDTTALDAIDNFVSGQRLLVAGMLDLNATAGREKVTESLALLTVVEQRSVAARSALACGAKPTGADALGPIPGGCAVTTQGGVKTTGGTNAPAPEGTTVNPPNTGVTGIPQDLIPSAAATPAKQEEKTDDGLLGELGRILGGLLGG
ncbi:hypothetical protein Rhe02_67850 [Rhizocola hellebori]|uniref:DUF5667 domain-containing protein n=1 Tax=Rhizocola hellebori TaxID=1392758 RepID=A0A8J3QD68_9ACTN|nr:hypothetical protein Rhe02_67850 [Rhizocola hellebori]